MKETSRAETQTQGLESSQKTTGSLGEQRSEVENVGIEARVNEAHEVSSELSVDDFKQRTARTGVVERLYDNSVDDATVKQIRKAAHTSIEESGIRTDAEIRDWVAESAHRTVVSLDIKVVEDDETHTLSWFEDELPRKLLLDLTDTQTLSGVIQQRLPLVSHHGAVWVAGEREQMDDAMMSLRPKYMGLLAQYEGTDRRDDTAEVIVSAGMMGALASFFAAGFALAGSISTLVPIVLMIATVVFTYGIVSIVWPTETLYGRSLRPEWLA